MDLFLDIFKDALLDTLHMLPFLFAAYLLMEYLEHRGGDAMEHLLARTSRYGAVVGGLLGTLPQCGFSVAAASLYNSGLITMGTLLAVFISTSDEALPMLLASPDNLGLTLKLVGIKLILGVSAGLLLDMLLRNHKVPEISLREDSAVAEHNEHCHCGPSSGEIFLTSLKHTLNTSLFIFGVSFALGGAIVWAGEDNIAAMLMTGSIFQPLVAALVGFIPNCAASVVLTRLLMEGAISFGSAIAGLTTGAGMGMLVLV
ncbi:MAG: putative manganese transporter, partial [Angelakisella sp.]